MTAPDNTSSNDLRDILALVITLLLITIGMGIIGEFMLSTTSSAQVEVKAKGLELRGSTFLAFDTANNLQTIRGNSQTKRTVVILVEIDHRDYSCQISDNKYRATKLNQVVTVNVKRTSMFGVVTDCHVP